MKRGLLLGIQVLLFLFSVLSIVAFITLRDEMRGLVYQLPRHAADYKAQFEPLCTSGQDEEYVTMPGPPLGAVVLIDNCEMLSTKGIVRGVTSGIYLAATIADVKNAAKSGSSAVKSARAVMEGASTVGKIAQVAKVLYSLKGVVLIAARTIIWNIALSLDPDPEAIIDQYETASVDLSTVLGMILEGGDSSFIRVPVGVDEIVVVSDMIEKEGGTFSDHLLTLDEIRDAKTGGDGLLQDYIDINNIISSMLLDMNDKPYADAHFSASASPSYTFVGDDDEIFLRPEHATRIFSSFSSAAKMQCNRMARNADNQDENYNDLLDACEELETALGDREFLLVDQNVVGDYDDQYLNPWQNVTSYIQQVGPELSQVCDLQGVLFSDEEMTSHDIADLCGFYSQVTGSLTEIDRILANATLHLQDAKEGRRKLNEEIRSVYMEKSLAEADASSATWTNGHPCWADGGNVCYAGGELNVYEYMNRTGNCVGRDIVLHDESGTEVATLKLPYCAFQVNCQKDELALMDYEKSCMVQLINVGSDGYPVGPDVSPIDALPAGPIEYPSAASFGAVLGERLVGGLRMGASVTSALPLLGSQCNGFDPKQVVWCLEAETGCAATDVNCRFCYTFNCNVPVRTYPEPSFGITARHTGDEIELRGNFLPH